MQQTSTILPPLNNRERKFAKKEEICDRLVHATLYNGPQKQVMIFLTILMGPVQPNLQAL
jgi:hypothetical protein